MAGWSGLIRDAKPLLIINTSPKNQEASRTTMSIARIGTGADNCGSAPPMGLIASIRAVECFVHYRHNPQDPGSLSDNTVNTIYEDRRGKSLDRHHFRAEQAGPRHGPVFAIPA
jgi:hypothetical protein